MSPSTPIPHRARPLPLAVLAAFCCLLGGCPSTRPYRPLPGPETLETARARRDVFPDDVRAQPGAFETTVVAWPGLLRESVVTETEDGFLVESEVEHRFYDWLEDFSVQRETIFLSPRGEGRFHVAWRLRRKAPGATIEDVREAVAPGHMVIVYGEPTSVDGDSVVLQYRYLRIFDPQTFRTDVFDYGRPGGSIRWLGR